MKEIETKIGDREFTFYTLAPFAAIKHGARLKSALAAGALDGGLEANAIQLLAGLDEHFVPNVIMPILSDCVVVCTSAQKKVTTEKEVNELYSVEDLDEFFELIGAVLGANFGPVLKKILARCGIHLDKLDLKSLTANLLKSDTDQTSPTK